MSLRTKTLLIIGLVLLGLLLAMFFIAQNVLLTSFAQLEDQAMRQNIQRAENALDDELTRLSRANRDWSQWDDTYQFIEDSNEDFIVANMDDVFLINLGLNLMVFVNGDGEIVYSKAIDLEAGEETALPEGLNAHFPPGSPLFVHPSNDSTVTGLVVLPEGPLLVASRPIIDTAGTAEPRGSLIFGRFLDAAQIETFSNSLRLPIQMALVDDAGLPDDFRAALNELTMDAPVEVKALNADNVAAYALVDDVNGQAALLLRVAQPRDIYAQGQSTLSFLVLLLVVAGLVFAAGIIMLLERAVLRPLTRLGESVSSVTRSGDISARVIVPSVGGELASLGRDINRMLDALEQTQRHANESSYRLSAIVQSAPIMLWAVDEKGAFTLLEGKGLDILKIDGRAAVGKKAADVFKNVPQIWDEMRRAQSGQTIESLVPVAEYTFDTRYTPLRDAEGKVVGLIGVATDITERIMAERALTDAYEDLNSKHQHLERVQEFFRSTLNLMTDSVKRDAPRQEIIDYLSYVGTQVERL